MSAGTNPVAPSPKPVQLQINTSGAWRKIVDFDAADDGQSGEVMFHGAALCHAVGATARIVVADGTQDVLARWDTNRGWRARDGSPLLKGPTK